MQTLARWLPLILLVWIIVRVFRNRRQFVSARAEAQAAADATGGRGGNAVVVIDGRRVELGRGESRRLVVPPVLGRHVRELQRPAVDPLRGGVSVPGDELGRVRLVMDRATGDYHYVYDGGSDYDDDDSSDYDDYRGTSDHDDYRGTSAHDDGACHYDDYLASGRGLRGVGADGGTMPGVVGGEPAEGRGIVGSAAARRLGWVSRGRGRG